VYHSKAKHIKVRHHFIREHVLQGDIVLKYVDTKNQFADIFTKPLSKERFLSLRISLGMIPIS